MKQFNRWRTDSAFYPQFKLVTRPAFQSRRELLLMDFIDHDPYHTSAMVMKMECYSHLTLDPTHQISHRRYLARLRRDFCSKHRKTVVFTCIFKAGCSKLGDQSWVCLPLLYSRALRIQSWVFKAGCVCHFITRTNLSVSASLIHTHSSFVIGYVCYLLIHAYCIL